MIGQTYPSTPYVRRLTAANGWHGQLIRDRHGQPVAVVTVRIGPTWTDAVAIEGEDRVIAMRHRTNDDGLILPTELPGTSGAVWQRDGRAEDVLAELCELPDSFGGSR
ncbi:MAG: hypothetical protein GEU83_07525 [Pseudonocardiaceae bacterium]|nr:hypothetical protein [Pseudonocardiaceae bacterium]